MGHRAVRFTESKGVLSSSVLSVSSRCLGCMPVAVCFTGSKGVLSLSVQSVSSTCPGHMPVAVHLT